MWQELTKIALLGTERIGLKEGVLPRPLADTVQKLDGKTEEERFLDALALAYFYNESGREAIQLNLPPVKEAEPETLNYSDKASALLDDILKQGITQEPLLTLWLNQMAKKQLIAKPSQITALFNLAFASTRTKVKKQILDVVGNRGRWLMQFNENWNDQAAPSIPHENLWTDSTMAERKKLWTTTLANNKPKAIEWLEQSWPQEAIKDKETFVNLMEPFIDASLLTTITHWYNSFPEKDWEKATCRNIRYKLICYRLKLNDTKLVEKLTPVTSYFDIKKTKLLGLIKTGKAEIKLLIPTQPDAFFNEDNLVKLLGFDPKNPDFHVYESVYEYWFAQLMSLLHPNIWLGVVAESPAEVIASFTNAFHKKNTKAPLHWTLLSLENAIQLHGLPDWANAFLEHHPSASPRFYNALNATDLAKWTVKHRLLFLNNELKKHLITLFKGELPEAVTTQMIEQAQQEVSYYNYTEINNMLKLILEQASDPMLPHIQKWRLNDSEWLINEWDKRFVQPFMAAYKIKKEIETI